MSGKTELLIFDDHPPQVVVESAIFQDIYPSTALDNTTKIIEFQINGSKTEYLDLNDTLLSLKVKVVKGDGTNIKTADAVKPIPSNFFMNALFSDVRLSLNNIQIEGGDSLYAYKATIESALNFSFDSKRYQLLPTGYCDEYDEREKWGGESAEFELVGALRLDFFRHPKYLIPGVDVSLRLTKSSDGFALNIAAGKVLGTNTFEVIFTQAKLYVRRVKVSPSVELGHNTGLVKKNAIYPYTRTKTIRYVIPTGSSSFLKENIFGSAQLPKFMVVGMVSGEAFNGSYTKEPFDFAHFDVAKVALYRDGQMIPYKNAYNTDFGKKHFADAYVRSILHNTQLLNTNNNNGIDMSDFAENSYCFFTFNQTPDFDMNQPQVVKDSNLRLDIQFINTLKESINVVVYGIFDGKIEITKDKRIIKDART